MPARKQRAMRDPMSITQNRKAGHEYHIEERFEAGLVLEGWEVKSIRAGRAQMNEAYVIVRGAELFLINAHIGTLPTTSTHVLADPTRTRKLLLKAEEIRRLIGKVERAGYALVPLDLHFSRGRVKLALGLAKGKRQFEKRAAEQERDWKREQSRLLKQRSK
jgi:SsrA-binding protein